MSKLTKYDMLEFAEVHVDNVQSGWVDTKGEFYQCKWGKHTDLAYDLITKHGMLDEYWEAEEKNCMENARDWLVIEKNWILLDNPGNTSNEQTIIYNPLVARPKAQRNKLLDLFEYDLCMLEYITEEMK